MSTPRERVQQYVDAATDPRANAPYMAFCADADGRVAVLDPRDLIPILAANTGYEQLIRDAEKRAVADLKRELVRRMVEDNEDPHDIMCELEDELS